METSYKEQIYINFLEVINNALAPESLLKDTFQIIYKAFEANKINRIQIWKHVTNSNDMSVSFEYYELKEDSMIKYRVPALPKETKRIFEKRNLWEYLNIKCKILNNFNIYSLIGIELKTSEQDNWVLVLTSKGKNLNFVKEEKIFISKLASWLETAIMKTEKFHRHNDQIKRLKNQNATLREQEQLKTNLINNISHEFRTPLSSILGFSNLLLNKKHSEETVKEISEQIQQAANRLSLLLSDFLQISKSAIDLWIPKIEPCDLGEIIKTSVEEFALLNRGHKLCYNILDNYPIINTDQKLVRLVLDNLISNAIKYSPNGGTISVSLELPKKEIKISVSDKGIGISKEDQPKVFNRFYRSSNLKIQNISGSGLGLAICKEIITTLNGKIEVKSELNKGSIFSFSLLIN